MKREILKQYKSLCREITEISNTEWKTELLSQKLEIESFVESIPDSITRRIFRYKYYNGMSWQKIAFCVGGGNSADGVRMIHNRYLQKYEKENQKNGNGKERG